jgi:hypothetical protein
LDTNTISRTRDPALERRVARRISVATGARRIWKRQSERTSFEISAYYLAERCA